MQFFVIAVASLLIIMTSAAAADVPVAEPSLYSAAYLPPKPVVVIGGPLHYNSPYDGAVASTSTSVFRTPGHPGQVSAVHKTVETPYSSAHKADVRYTNDVQLPYHNYPAAAVPYGYGPTAVPYGHGPVAVPYGHGPVAVQYGHGPVAAAAAAYSHGPTANTVVTPYSVSHASFSGPHGTHYSYKR